MHTDCTPGQLEFHGFGRRSVVGAFDGGRQTSDAGVVLLREVAERTGLIRRFAACFTDHRRAERIEHTVEELVGQRVLAQALGYEDLSDHDRLRDDALLALAAGKRDLLGERRRRAEDRGHALAGKSTLNRFELTPVDANAASRYKKIVYDGAAIDALFVDHFLEAHERPPEQVLLDLDVTDDALHGHQEGRFFHGYYGHYCYLPLYIFCGEFLLCARLRTSDRDAAAGTVEELERIVERIRARWPEVRMAIRADSGFARDEILAWCEARGIDYVIGLARNARLQAALTEEMAQATARCEQTGQPARLFKDFRYRTLDSWSRERRVVGKAEALPGKANPRFVVSSFAPEDFDARALYEDLYCARGDMENRIKEQQLGMFADRTSTATLRANQLRLWIASLAYALAHELRRVGLRHTALARAQMTTIRLRLLKIGASVHVSVRRVRIAFSSVFPLQRVFAEALHAIQRASPLRA